MSTFNLIAHLQGLLVEELELNGYIDYYRTQGYPAEESTEYTRLQAVKQELAKHAGSPAAQAAFDAFLNDY